ncbi:MAG: hypothetical protein PF442_10410 [Desulfobulbaceae bacterium]|jgi:hypothetical protein|nr:hypothetical protein [Desulfobulbaceae bacterium]
MPNRIRQEVKKHFGLNPEMTDLEFSQTILTEEPGNVTAKELINKMKLAGNEGWKPVDESQTKPPIHSRKVNRG